MIKQEADWTAQTQIAKQELERMQQSYLAEKDEFTAIRERLEDMKRAFGELNSASQIRVVALERVITAQRDEVRTMFSNQL